jgi:hypothetical protein
LVFIRYDILFLHNIRKLIFPINGEGKVLFYVNDGELYAILKATHDYIGHGGRDRMISKLSLKYKNIIRSDVVLLQLCELYAAINKLKL